MVNESSVRLYAIIARDASQAVIFRRGPSKQVLLVVWNTDSDQFQEGQWLKGRIYERRCDLSPDGNLLIYFAADYKEPYFSWTAISKPPYLTALAVWPKGDGWGGGGLFRSDAEILLNHRANEMLLAQGFQLPKEISVSPFGERPGWGEDSPIIDERLERDGWRFVQRGTAVKHELGDPLWIELNPPKIWSKVSPSKSRGSYELQQFTNGLHERDGSWYVTEHFVVDRTSQAKMPLGRTDWADWDKNGDLLFAKDGKIFRVGFNEGAPSNLLSDAKILLDLSNRKFATKDAPAEAKTW